MTQQTTPIDLYYTATPNGKKISVALEELGVPYRTHYVRIGRGEQFRPEFLAISPNNKIPAIVDPEGPGGTPISIFESGAILKYLATKFGQFYPADARAQAKVDEWLFWQVGGLGPMLGQAGHFRHAAPEQVPYALKRYTDEANRLYRVLDMQLDGKDYVAGEYSIADMAILGWVNSFEYQAIELDQYPNVKAWLNRLKARPAVARGLALDTTTPGVLPFVSDPLDATA